MPKTPPPPRPRVTTVKVGVKPADNGRLADWEYRELLGRGTGRQRRGKRGMGKRLFGR